MTSAPGLARRFLRRLTHLAASETYLVLLVSAACGLLMLGVGAFVMSDTWLALVVGRVVAESGPPSTDTLTAWTLGREWVDQQWLGQFALYELWRIGGIVLVGLVHVAVVTATFVFTLVAARLRGGSARHVALVGLLATLPIGLVAGNIRTQTFAFALFAIVLWLLSEDSREPSARVFWCAPVLAVWANVHGSVIVGAGLTAVAGAVCVAGGWRSRRRAGVGHGAALIVIAGIALLVTPYGFGMFSYLGDLFGNAEIPRIASDWQPTALEPVHAPFFILAGVALALVGRHPQLLTGFERSGLIVLLVGALLAQRNLAWFCFAAVLLLPPLMTHGRTAGVGEPPPVWLAASVSAGMVAAAILATFVGLGHAERHVESRFPTAAAAIVDRQLSADPSLRVYTDPHFADWLLFRHPRLAGRIPFDVRLELLTEAELRRYRRFRDQVGSDWMRAAGAARLFVLDSSDKPLGVLPPASSELLREPGARRLYARHDIAVIRRSQPSEDRQR